MTTTGFSELKALLEQDLSSLEALSGLLQEEQKALGANEMMTLAAVVSAKNSILDGLRARAREKVRHLVAAGFKPNNGAPSEFLERLGDDDLTGLWHKVHKAMSRCQAANVTNGQVITHLQKRTARLSEIIRGVNPSHKLYGAGGREESVSHKSVLANA